MLAQRDLTPGRVFRNSALEITRTGKLSCKKFSSNITTFHFAFGNTMFFKYVLLIEHVESLCQIK
jgi:hypothetical protein